MGVISNSLKYDVCNVKRYMLTISHFDSCTNVYWWQNLLADSSNLSARQTWLSPGLPAPRSIPPGRFFYMSDCKETMEFALGLLNIFVTAGAAFFGAISAYWLQKWTRITDRKEQKEDKINLLKVALKHLATKLTKQSESFNLLATQIGPFNRFLIPPSFGYEVEWLRGLKYELCQHNGAVAVINDFDVLLYNLELLTVEEKQIITLVSSDYINQRHSDSMIRKIDEDLSFRFASILTQIELLLGELEKNG